MAYLIEQVNPKIAAYIRKRRSEGKTTFALCGGRRSGKTFCISQFLLTRLYKGDIINVASMTAEQGRLGAYADMRSIVMDHPTLNAVFECLQSPREIRFRDGRKGCIFFNSYANSETAKGVACDWLFINEANNFSKQQVVDLKANVRLGTFFDYNPNVEFWISDLFEEDEICHTTWKDNPFLTPAQLEYFDQLKKDAERPTASALDIHNYNVYYLGKFSEMRGAIFIEENLHFCDDLPSGLYDFRIFCDPSALRGADWFACVLSAKGQDGKVYVVDVFSTNTGSREMVVSKLREWAVSYDDVRIYIETNGIIGIDFFEFAHNSELPIEGFYSRGNKFERIVGNYQNICDNMVFHRTPSLPAYMSQVYEFDVKCDHDDNIDAISSTYTLQKYQ